MFEGSIRVVCICPCSQGATTSRMVFPWPSSQARAVHPWGPLITPALPMCPSTMKDFASELFVASS
eukprot:11176623-Lingulodinium_polyedra.AAC.1